MSLRHRLIGLSLVITLAVAGLLALHNQPQASGTCVPASASPSSPAPSPSASPIGGPTQGPTSAPSQPGYIAVSGEVYAEANSIPLSLAWLGAVAVYNNQGALVGNVRGPSFQPVSNPVGVRKIPNDPSDPRNGTFDIYLPVGSYRLQGELYIDGTTYRSDFLPITLNNNSLRVKLVIGGTSQIIAVGTAHIALVESSIAGTGQTFLENIAGILSGLTRQLNLVFRAQSAFAGSANCGTIFGTVRDKRNQAQMLANVAVRLAKDSGATTVATTQTNQVGLFKFENIPVTLDQDNLFVVAPISFPAGYNSDPRQIEIWLTRTTQQNPPNTVINLNSSNQYAWGDIRILLSKIAGRIEGEVRDQPAIGASPDPANSNPATLITDRLLTVDLMGLTDGSGGTREYRLRSKQINGPNTQLQEKGRFIFDDIRYEEIQAYNGRFKVYVSRLESRQPGGTSIIGPNQDYQPKPIILDTNNNYEVKNTVINVATLTPAGISGSLKSGGATLTDRPADWGPIVVTVEQPSQNLSKSQEVSPSGGYSFGPEAGFIDNAVRVKIKHKLFKNYDQPVDLNPSTPSQPTTHHDIDLIPLDHNRIFGRVQPSLGLEPISAGSYFVAVQVASQSQNKTPEEMVVVQEGGAYEISPLTKGDYKVIALTPADFIAGNYSFTGNQARVARFENDFGGPPAEINFEIDPVSPNSKLTLKVDAFLEPEKFGKPLKSIGGVTIKIYRGQHQAAALAGLNPIASGIDDDKSILSFELDSGPYTIWAERAGHWYTSKRITLNLARDNQSYLVFLVPIGACQQKSALRGAPATTLISQFWLCNDSAKTYSQNKSFRTKIDSLEARIKELGRTLEVAGPQVVIINNIGTDLVALFGEHPDENRGGCPPPLREGTKPPLGETVIFDSNSLNQLSSKTIDYALAHEMGHALDWEEGENRQTPCLGFRSESSGYSNLIRLAETIDPMTFSAIVTAEIPLHQISRIDREIRANIVGHMFSEYKTEFCAKVNAISNPLFKSIIKRLIEVSTNKLGSCN